MTKSSTKKGFDATVLQRTDEAVWIDDANGAILRDGLRSYRDDTNTAKKKADEVAAYVNGLMNGASQVFSASGELLFFYKYINKSPAINWELLEKDLATIGKKRSDYEVAQPKTRQLHTAAPVPAIPAPTVAVTSATPVLPVQLNTETAPETKPKKKVKNK